MSKKKAPAPVQTVHPGGLKGEEKTQSTLQGWEQGFFSRPYQIISLVCILLYAQILTFGLVHFDDHGFVCNYSAGIT